MNYRYARLPERGWELILRMERQIKHDTGRELVLLAYEPEPEPTPVFDDRQRGGPALNKQNIFNSQDNLFGNITQWHI